MCVSVSVCIHLLIFLCCVPNAKCSLPTSVAVTVFTHQATLLLYNHPFQLNIFYCDWSRHVVRLLFYAAFTCTFPQETRHSSSHVKGCNAACSSAGETHSTRLLFYFSPSLFSHMSFYVSPLCSVHPSSSHSCAIV